MRIFVSSVMAGFEHDLQDKILGGGVEAGKAVAVTHQRRPLQPQQRTLALPAHGLGKPGKKGVG